MHSDKFLCYNVINNTRNNMILHIPYYKKIDKSLVNQDNIKFFDNIVKNKGVIMSLDVQSYIDFCLENNIYFFTQHEW